MIKALAVMMLAIAAIAFLIPSASAKIREGGPDRLDETSSLGDLISAGRTVHVVFVHGMRAEGPGAAEALVALLKTDERFALAGGPEEIQLSVGAWPSKATYLETPIWRTPADWIASQPFIRRFKLGRADGARIVVDEVNWWPLIFPLKCRFLLLPEHDLSGDDRTHLDLCQRTDGHYHDWFDESDLARLAAGSKGGGAPLMNRMLKQQIMNWGLSDAVIANGQMRPYLNVAMDQAFAAVRDETGPEDTIVVMSESLGSFVVLDALAAGSEPVAEVFDRTANLYFFANQFALLELGRLGDMPPPETASPALKAFAVPDVPSPLQTLRAWAEGGRNFRGRPRQIIAFSDPSDLLTYVVPPIKGATVVNLYDRNATRWLGLFANPAAAHTGHLRNTEVRKVLFKRRHADPASAGN